MASIGPNVIGKIEKLVHDMLFTYMEAIDAAFSESEKGIKFPLPISIKPGEKAPLRVKVGFGPLSKGKIQDEVEAEMGENQVALFDKDGKEGV